MFIGGNDDTNTNTCNMTGYVQDVRFYLASKYAANFAPATAVPVAKTATLVSSTATTMRIAVTPDYRDVIAVSVALRGPNATAGTATCITRMADLTPAIATTVSARYLRLTLFYAGGDGTSGPAFAKLGVYSEASDAYEDTGASAKNIARSATFLAVSGGVVGSNTPTAMRACIDDTRTTWTASTAGATFQTTLASGPAYYTVDLGAVRTIGALRLGEVSYESTGASLFSARLEASSDSVAWDLVHLVNAYGHETQRSVHAGYTLAPPAPTRRVGESLVLAVVSRAYRPTGYTFPTALGAVSGALSEGRVCAIRVPLPVAHAESRGATAVVAHSASGHRRPGLRVRQGERAGRWRDGGRVRRGGWTGVRRPARAADAPRGGAGRARLWRHPDAHAVVRRRFGQCRGLAGDVRVGCRRGRSRLAGDDPRLGDRLVGDRPDGRRVAG
jgi:hypothetical protein